LTETAEVYFTDDEVAQLGAERIILLCFRDLTGALGPRVGPCGACAFTCRRHAKGFVMTARPLEEHEPAAGARKAA
jgi:hypothetical protein